jgi:hypothetical protein
MTATPTGPLPVALWMDAVLAGAVFADTWVLMP